jgi:hypothetical protein
MLFINKSMSETLYSQNHLLFIPTIKKICGQYVMAYALASVSVNIWFLSIKRQTPVSIHLIFMWIIGGD